MRNRLKLYQLFSVVLMVSVMAMAGCDGGGGGGGSTAPAGSKQVVSKGAITQLGSIYVNGVRYDTSAATITMDDPEDSAGGLQVGMVVTVKGTFSDSTNAKASSVIFSDNLKGPIAEFDNAAGTMTVLGQQIKFSSTTVFDDFPTNGTSSVAPGQMVQVSGFADPNGIIQATRIERHLPDWTASTSVELKGTIGTKPGASLFTIGGLTIDASGLTVPGVGSFVKVEGKLAAFNSTTLKATSVSLRKDGIEIEEEDGNHIDVEGYVRNLAGNTFMVGDTLVNAGTLSLAGIANGVKVEVEGSYLNGILIASEIEIEDGTVPPPTTVPAAPAVSAVGGVKQVTISWNGVSGATSYNIYWSTTAGVTGTLLANATSSPYMQTGLTAATTYYYVVRAVNAAGEGAPSVQVSATTAPTAPQPPSAPTGVTTTVVSPTQVNVSWSAVTGAVSYNIYWSTTTGVTPATGTLIANATSPYSHTGRTASTTYFYVVTAVNAAGESAPSAQASATTTATPMPPAAPTGVTAVGGTNQVTVSWATVTGATSYNLYWSTTAGVTPATGTLIANVTSPFVHMGRAASTTYYYVVTAVNSVGSSAPSAQVSATTAAAPLVCGTCHAIPPATGAHDFHVNSLGYSCAICHGTGYSSTAVNTTLHLNNVVNVVSNLGWNATTSTCATPGCHGSRGW